MADGLAVFLAVDGRAVRREVPADSLVVLVVPGGPVGPVVPGASPEGQAGLPAVRLAVWAGQVDSPAE